jgi:hypothetical protein
VTTWRRVQIIKPDPNRTGVLEFGTKLISGADNSIVALLGASRAPRTCRPEFPLTATNDGVTSR